MSFELPEDPREVRRARITGWVTTILTLALVAVIGYLGWVGYDGSARMVEPPDSTDCRTPDSAFGWAYEALNYEQATDVALAAVDDPLHCDRQGAPAGEALVTSDGIRLAGWYVPAGDGSPASGPTLVLAHPESGNKSAMLDIAAQFHTRYNLVLFDFRGHGQSSGQVTTEGVTEQRDLRAVLEWVETVKAPAHIAVLGVGMGGATAVNVAAADLRTDAVILESTHATLIDAAQARLDAQGLPLSIPGAWSVLLGGLLRTGQDMSSVDPVQAIERLDVPVLIVSGGNDRLIGADDAQQMEDAARAAGVDVERMTCEGAARLAVVSTCEQLYRQTITAFLNHAFALADAPS